MYSVEVRNGLKMLLAQGLAPHLHACILRAKEI